MCSVFCNCNEVFRSHVYSGIWKPINMVTLYIYCLELEMWIPMWLNGPVLDTALVRTGDEESFMRFAFTLKLQRKWNPISYQVVVDKFFQPCILLNFLAILLGHQQVLEFH